MSGQERDLLDAVQALQGDEGRWGLTPQRDPIAESARQLSIGPARPLTPAARFPSPLFTAEAWPEPAQEAIKSDDEWALLGIAGAPEPYNPFTDPRAPRMLQKFHVEVSSDDTNPHDLETKLAGFAGDSTYHTVSWETVGGGAAETIRPKVTKVDLTHTVLSATHTDADTETVVEGDLIYGNATPSWDRRGIGNTDDVLTVSGGVPVWASSVQALLDGTKHSDTDTQSVTRGSLIYGNATPAWSELVIGSANYVLTSDGTDAAWASRSHAMLDADWHSDSVAQTVTEGSLIVGNATPAWDELPICTTDGAVLTSTGSAPAWNIPTGHDPWIAVSASGGVLDINHGGPGASCHCAEYCSGGIIMDLDIDELGHVRYICVCGYGNYGDGCCVGPCGDSPE